MIDLIGDLHVKKSNIDKQEILFDMIEESENNDVILTGDLLDKKSIIRSECLNFLFHRLRKSLKHFWIIVGNHDQHHLGTLKHSLETLKALDNVTIIDELDTFRIGGLNFVGIPYIDDEGEFVDTLKAIKNKKDKILICHQGFTGFDYGTGYIAKEETNVDSVKAFKKVYSGHFHKYQKFTNGCYIGTSFSQTFGESNQTKYIGEIQENGELTLIETNFPQHRTYEVDCDIESNILENYKELDYNRIILTGSKESISEFDKTRFKGTKIISRPTPEKIGKNIEISETLSNAKKFEFWAKEVGQMHKDTIKLGIEILKTVS